MYYYSPHTLELISTDHPQDWMVSTDIPPPQSSNCFFVNGAWEVRPDYAPPAPTYQELRAAAFAEKSFAEQLDMQYWDAVNGTTIWKDWVAGIKAMYPKPM